MKLSRPDVFGTAIRTYYHQPDPELKIWVDSSLTRDEEIPLWYMFRTYDEMPPWEHTALEHCRGRILDAGAGAGCHALELEARGYKLTAIDTSPGAVEIMRSRGIQDTRLGNILTFADNARYDTVLLLMNGLGLAGTLGGLDKLLAHLRSRVLRPGGQVLLETTDISYMFGPDGAAFPDDHYFGEVWYRIRFRNLRSQPFDWLYIDRVTLRDRARAAGFSYEFLAEGDNYNYLVRLGA